MYAWQDECVRPRRWSIRAPIRLVAWLVLLGGAVACDDEEDPGERPPTLTITSPQTMVEADEVEIRVDVADSPGKVDVIRYTVGMTHVAGTAGTVATGELYSADGERHTDGVTLDAEGVYKLRVTAYRSGKPVAEAERDFKYQFVPPPAPRLPELPESPADVAIGASPGTYALVVDTEPGVRIEVSRGDALLGRATATTDRVEVDIELEAGENPLTVRAWRRQASAETGVVLNAEVVEDAPPAPPSVAALCAQKRYDAAWRARGRLEGDPAGSRALTECLVRGATRAEAWARVAELVGQSADTGLPLSTLISGAVANGHTNDDEARDALWRRVVDRIAESRGDDLISTGAAARLGARIAESGASASVLLSCVDHREPDHPCAALTRAAAPEAPPTPDPEGDPPLDAGAAAPPPADPWRPISSACEARDYTAAGRLYRGLADRDAHAPSRAERLCIALGLRMGGDCALAIETAEPLAGAIAYETTPALQIIAGCQGAIGERDAAAASWRRAIGLALAGRSSFLVSPARVRRDLDATGLDDARRAKAVEPCAEQPRHTLCDALVDAPAAPSESVATLCREGRHAEAADHPDAADAEARFGACIARGHIDGGRPQPARQILRAALKRMQPGAQMGEASRLLAQVSEGQEQVDAMKRAVEMVAQALYIVEDEAAFYREITDVQGRGPALRAILAPCEQARRRAACGRLLAHFDVGEPAPEPEAPPPPDPEAPPPPDPPEPDAGKPRPTPPPPSDEPADVVARPAGARMELRVDGGKLERDTPSGAFTFPEDSVPPGAHRFTVTASNAEPRRGTINLGRRSKKQGPVRLYAHRSAAHADFSAGITALGKGALPAAIAAFTKATRADGDFCMAWTYLGYAQGLSGKSKVARGSFRRCSSSLGNDLEAVVAARVLQRVVDLRAGIDGPPDRLRTLVEALGGTYGQLRYLFKVLPGSRRGAVRLGDVHKYWMARGQTALWRALAESGSPDAEAACKEALAAWRKLRPGMRIEGRSIVSAAADFSTERQQALTALGAACK